MIKEMQADVKNVLKEVVKIDKRDLEEIKELMEAYSENCNLYDEFGIEEYATLYFYSKVFENNRSISINISSGQRNCYIDSILYDEFGNELCVENVDGFLEDGDLFEFEDIKNCYKLIIKAC